MRANIKTHKTGSNYGSDMTIYDLTLFQLCTMLLYFQTGRTHARGAT